MASKSPPSAEQSQSTGQAPNATVPSNQQSRTASLYSQRTSGRRSGAQTPVSMRSPRTSRENSPSRLSRRPSNNLVTQSSTAKSTAQTPSSTTAGSEATGLSADAIEQAFSASKKDNEGASQSWPVSPRLRSPPPTGNVSRRNSQSSVRQSEADGADFPGADGTLSRTASESRLSIDSTIKSSNPAPVPASSAHKAPRGFSGLTTTLETVVEGDQSSPPRDSSGIEAAARASNENQSSGATYGQTSPTSSTQKGSTKDDSSETKITDSRRSSMSIKPVSNAPSKKSSPVASKGRSSAEGSSSGMIVETETVNSKPHTSINTATVDRSGPSAGHGSLRQRPSNETVKAKKERKKNGKKHMPILSGTGSTKADIFEAKVATAVDEDSDDSDDTFVYDSNPPETRARAARHHSRTPSATSYQSLSDRRAPNAALPQGHSAVRPKRSMKFATNTFGTFANDSESGDKDATPRASTQRASNGSVRRNNHLGLHSRGNGNDSPIETDSPFSQTSKYQKFSSARNSPKPNSTPRFNKYGYLRSPAKNGSSLYDSAAENFDEERTPLVSTIRGLHNPRLYNGANYHFIDDYDDPPRGFKSRWAGCMVLLTSLIIIFIAVAGILYSTTQTLYDVQIRQIRNVLASEQELMLDLHVRAVNPNIVAITVNNMDINVFAKSRHVGSSKFWREHPGQDPTHNDFGHTWEVRQSGSARHRGSSAPPPISILDDDPVDPLPGGHNRCNDDDEDGECDDPSADRQTMLLGRIFHFDSSLTFEASPIKRHPHDSTGGLRLQKPGNKTEAGGSERWERVVKYPFELIVRGILKYSVPLSNRMISASVGASVMVNPSAGVGVGLLDFMEITELDESSEDYDDAASPRALVASARDEAGDESGTG